MLEFSDSPVVSTSVSPEEPFILSENITDIHESVERDSNQEIILPGEDLSLRSKVRLVRDALKEDQVAGNRLQRFGRKLGIVATMGWLAYEWGPGNETVTPILAGQVINTVNGPQGIVTAAGITAGFTFIQQVMSGGTLAATATQYPNAAKQVSEFTQDTDNPELSAKPWKDLSLRKRFLYAFTMGTTFIATREAGVTGEVKFRETMKRVVGSAALSACGVGVLAAGVESVDSYAENAPQAIETGSEIAVSIATNPLTWLGLLGISTYKDYRHRKNLQAQLANIEEKTV